MKNSPMLRATHPPGPRPHGNLAKAGEQQNTDKRDAGSFGTADSYVLFCERVCARVFVCVSPRMFICLERLIPR